MKSLFGNRRHFMYGRTCLTKAEVRPNHIVSALRQSVKAVSARAIPVIAAAVIASSSRPGEISLGRDLSANSPGLDAQFGPAPPVIRNLLRHAREYLELSQDSAAGILRVSPSSVEKFEHGSVKTPSAETLERYKALVELADLYRERFGHQKYLVRLLLHQPTHFYGDKSAFEFARERELGIFELLGLEKRKHA